MTDYDRLHEPDVLGDHAGTLIATTMAHLGVDTVCNNFGTLRNAIDADNLITPTRFAPGDGLAACYAKLAPEQRRTIVSHALQILDHV